jgi:hypothetical protein
MYFLPLSLHKNLFPQQVSLTGLTELGLAPTSYNSDTIFLTTVTLK